MPQAELFFRLRIRTAADDADDLVISSIPTDTAPYLAGPPSGDGQSFDPLTGVSTVGVYTGQIIDAVTNSPNAGDRIVTAKLSDANGRQQYLSRRAYWEQSDGGPTPVWEELVGGYVNSLRLVMAHVFEVAIGDTRRIAQTRKAFSSVSSSAEGPTCMIGGPIRNGFGPIYDPGGWRYKVVSKVAGETVTLAFQAGWLKSPNIAGYARAIAFAVGTATRINQNWRPDFVPTQLADGVAVSYGWFPNINIELWNLAGTTLDGARHPIAQSIPRPSLDGQVLIVDNAIGLTGGLVLHWTTDQPDVNDEFVVYGYRTTIGPDNPLHLIGHPVDLETDRFTAFNIAYDATAAAAVKAALGADLRVLLRISDPPLLQDFQASLRRFFGYGSRRNAQGEEELFLSRLKGAAAPTTEITLDDLATTGPPIFDLDEGTICNTLTLKQHRFVLWTEDDGGERPADDLTMVPQTRTLRLSSSGGPTPDADTFGEREQTYELPGYIARKVAQTSVLTWARPYQPVDFDAFGDAMAAELFDRYGRGAIRGELELAHRAVTEAIGDELKLTLPHQVNASSRGGSRCVQILQRTETTHGPRLAVLDSGTTAQPSVNPTFTLAQGADDARKLVDVAITNAAALNAAGAEVTVEYGSGATEPTGGTKLVHFPTSITGGAGTSIPATFTTEPFDAGAHVWLRMRSHAAGKRPGAWTAWDDVQLDPLDAPTGLSLTPGSGFLLAAWTAGANAGDMPIEVYLRRAAEATPLFDLVARLPAGSTRSTVYQDAGDWIVGVRHAEPAPFGGVSPLTEEAETIGSTPTLDPPTGPIGIGSGSGDGIYGLQVLAGAYPSQTEFVVAIETAIGSGTPGSYGTMATLATEGGGAYTTWTGSAPDDGLRRYVKARHTRTGATESAYTTEVETWPWYQYPI